MGDRIVVRGGTVLTLGHRSVNHPVADVLIEGGDILEIAPALRVRDAQAIDASGCIVLPGFVDVQRAAWTSMLRGATFDGSFQASARRGELEPEALRVATLLSLVTALEAGITTVVDWCDVALDSARVAAVAEAHVASGARTVWVPAGTAAADRSRSEADRANLPDWQDEYGATVERCLTDARRGAAGARSEIAAIGFAAGGLAGRDVGRWQAELEFARAKRQQIFAPFAVTEPSEAAEAERELVDALRSTPTMLGGDVTLLQATHASEAALDVVARSGARVGLTPTRDMTQGLGFPPLQLLLDRGIRPGVGTGDHLMTPADLFTPLQTVQSLQHARYFDLKLAGKAGLPNLLTTRDVIRYGTVEGAGAAGLAGITGSLEVGRRADVVVLRADTINVHPINDPIGAVVWAMDASNVDTVIVDGRVRVRDGRYVDDRNGLLQAVARAAQQLDPVEVLGGAA